MFDPLIHCRLTYDTNRYVIDQVSSFRRRSRCGHPRQLGLPWFDEVVFDINCISGPFRSVLPVRIPLEDGGDVTTLAKIVPTVTSHEDVQQSTMSQDGCGIL